MFKNIEGSIMRHQSHSQQLHQSQHGHHGHHGHSFRGAMRELLCMVGGRAGHRFGGGRGSGSGGFSGDDGMPRGRKLSSNDLQLLLLALLSEAPRHGYELIKMLDTRSNGFYSPSPGMIYPALTYLDEIGHATALQEGNRKLYSITEAGQQYLHENNEQAKTILDALERIGSRMEQMREAFAGLNDLDPEAADGIHRAKHALKNAMMSLRGCTPNEARRVTAILDRATAEILNGKA
jgi:DNA-binding PadR family transcriptional regulator